MARATRWGGLAAAFDRMLDRVERAFHRERRFSADASHELRTPLTAIKGCIGVTLARPRTYGEYQAALRDLDDQVDRLIRLCSDLLALSRAGRVRLEDAESMDLGELLTVVVQQIEGSASEYGVKLRAALRPGVIVKGSADDLIRLLLNLLTNAVKFTPPGGLVSVSLESKNRHAVVRVSDTGAGIVPEDQTRVFEPFYQGDGVTAAREKGAGLGLAISREIALAHGGTLEVSSRLGEGSVFTLRVPLER